MEMKKKSFQTPEISFIVILKEDIMSTSDYDEEYNDNWSADIFE